MEHNPIQTMLDEHEVIVSAVEMVEALENTWTNDPEGYSSKAKSLISFFREYADGYHHRKEEEVLFPAIKDHPDFVLDEMVDEFEQHHEDFREYATDAETALNNGEYADSFKHLTDYCNDLQDHIGAENDELFVLAETLLDEDDLETIFFKFKDVDMELGEDRKIELERQVQELSA